MLPEEKHVLSVLKTTMRVLGFSNRDLERELKLSGSYLSRLFSGDIDLRFSHILDLSRAMGLAPEEVLLLAYPPIEGPKSPAAQRLAAFMERRQVPPEGPEGMAPAAPTREEIEMEAAIEGVLAGILEQLTPAFLLAGGIPEVPEVPEAPEASEPREAPGASEGMPAPKPEPAPAPERPRRKPRVPKTGA
jgi:hypothetical protein